MALLRVSCRAALLPGMAVEVHLTRRLRSIHHPEHLHGQMQKESPLHSKRLLPPLSWTFLKAGDFAPSNQKYAKCASFFSPTGHKTGKNLTFCSLHIHTTIFPFRPFHTIYYTVIIIMSLKLFLTQATLNSFLSTLMSLHMGQAVDLGVEIPASVGFVIYGWIGGWMGVEVRVEWRVIYMTLTQETRVCFSFDTKFHRRFPKTLCLKVIKLYKYFVPKLN